MHYGSSFGQHNKLCFEILVHIAKESSEGLDEPAQCTD